jgi:hypothetical protein
MVSIGLAGVLSLVNGLLGVVMEYLLTCGFLADWNLDTVACCEA